MKILIITPRIPYPPYRGDKLKIYNISRILAQNNDVTILTFQRNSKQYSEINSLRKIGVKVEVVKLTILESLVRSFLNIFSSLPFQVAWYQSSRMKKKIAQLTVVEKYDVEYYHLVRSAQYLQEKTSGHSVLRILDFTDAVSLYLARLATAERNYIKKILINIERNRIKKHEYIAEKFHTLFICSPVDKKFLEDTGLNVNINILNNGIDTSYFNSKQTEYEKNRIIFTGNMPYYANYDAAIHFCNDIFPIILSRNSNAKFYIVGQYPPRRIKNLGNNNTVVTGFVENIKEEYLKSAVNIAPMRFGAGTLNKVIESIALGVPVVASPIAVQGLPEVLKEYILISDNPAGFAENILRVLSDPTSYREKMKEGQKIITEILSWEKIVGDFEGYLRSELQKLNS